MSYFSLSRLRKFLFRCLNGNAREQTLNCSWKALKLCPGWQCQMFLPLRNEVSPFTFKEQLAEIVKEISNKVTFKLMLRNKKLACGQMSPSFVASVRKVRALGCLSSHYICSPAYGWPCRVCWLSTLLNLP